MYFWYMEFKTIVYIVIGILYYLYQFNKRRQKNAQKEVQGQPHTSQHENVEDYTPPTHNQKPSKSRGFTEFLEEIVNDNISSESTKNTDYEEISGSLVEEDKSTEVEKTVDKLIDKLPHIQSKTYQEDELVDDEQVDYSELFSTHSSVQKAFVASEIFKRKY